MATKAIIDMSDDEINAQLRTNVESVNYMREEWLRELDRREAKRQAAETHRLTRLSVLAAIFSGAAAAVSALAAALD